jgi:hypothetical protein
LDAFDFFVRDVAKEVLQRVGVSDHRVTCDGDPLARVLLELVAQPLFGLYRAIKFLDGHGLLVLSCPPDSVVIICRLGLAVDGLSGKSTAAFDGSR